MSFRLKSIITGTAVMTLVAVVALAIGVRPKPPLPVAPPVVAVVPVEDLGTLADVPSVSPLDARPVATPAVAGSTEIPSYDPEQTIRVEGYRRKDGVYVRSHMRRPSKR